MAREYSVGEVAERCGIRIATLHFYEEKGLIFSRRNAGNQRRYRADVLRRVAVIKAAQRVGFTLKEIQTQLAALPERRTPTQKDWRRLSYHWQASLDQRIAYLQELRGNLTGCIGCGCLSMEKCPLYNPDDELASEGKGAVLLNRAWPEDEQD